MNILLIDDQPTILSSLTSNIPWYELGFTGIFTATDASKARKILNNNYIDIIVSDIEMPYENGLELLEWARECEFDFECILLTSHADFSYAQKAISLNVSEYITQPAKNEDIIRAVKRAIEKINAKKISHTHLQKANKFNTAAQNIVLKTLFEEWPSIEKIVINPDLLNSRLESLQQFGIQCEADSPCLIILTHIRKWNKLPLSAAEFLNTYQKLYNKLFNEVEQTNVSFYIKDNFFITIDFSGSTDNIPQNLKILFEKLPLETGAYVRLFHSSTELQLIRNTIDGIINYANQYTLTHFDDIQMLEINRDTLLASATGSDNYLHYSKMIHEFIHNNISEAIGRTDIADYLHLSPDNVSYIIKATENKTVKELINHIKMEHAQKMLKNTQYSIGEVAQKCGYDSFAYFSKVYRDTYGITPSQERQ